MQSEIFLSAFKSYSTKCEQLSQDLEGLIYSKGANVRILNTTPCIFNGTGNQNT